MNKIISTFLLFFLFACSASAQITPEISSWILNTNSATGYGSIPSNVQQVKYSANNVYVSATCIPGYDIGPWAGNPNIPANQNFLFKINRNPQQNSGTAIATGLGHIGVFTNGVSIFNPRDAMSYNNQNVWHQNAVVVEGPSFDDCLGHPAPNGEYHHHLNPTCLYDDSTGSSHSPIIGFSFDGFPIYGAFAYADTNGTGGIKRMQSSYRMRNINSRTTLPDGSTAGSAGPAVSGTYPLGYYVEDFEYISGSGDLDEHNGRFCKTPEYPNGHYCYFITLDSTLTPEYPYLIGPTYYGTVQAGNTGPGSGHNTITETVTTYNGTSGISVKEDIRFLLAPNPAQQYLSVMVSQESPDNLQLEIINCLGQIVLHSENIQTGVSYSFDLSSFNRGIYFAVIHSSGNSSSSSRIILQ